MIPVLWVADLTYWGLDLPNHHDGLHPSIPDLKNDSGQDHRRHADLKLAQGVAWASALSKSSATWANPGRWHLTTATASDVSICSVDSVVK